jgi:hypothetical protein
MRRSSRVARLVNPSLCTELLRRRRFAHVSLVLAAQLALLAGCSGSTGSWYWPAGNPEFKSWTDSTVDTRPYRRFGILPYSRLENDPSDTANESTMIFSLLNAFESRGYRFTDRLDSADFVVTQRISNDYRWHEDLSKYLGKTPPFERVSPFSPQTSGFGTYYGVPMPPRRDVASVRTFPKLVGTVYDVKSHKPIRQFVAGSVTVDPDYRVAAQYLIFDFANSFRRSDSSFIQSVGTGMMGINYAIWSYDGENYWPRVTEVLPESAAKGAGLKNSDMLLELDGIKLKNMDCDEFWDKVKGDAGRTLTFRVWRSDGKLFDVRLIMKPRVSK